MHLASTFEVPSIQKLSDWYPRIDNIARVLHWLKHSGKLKYITLYLFLNPGTSGLRKKICCSGAANPTLCLLLCSNCCNQFFIVYLVNSCIVLFGEFLINDWFFLLGLIG